jgi:tRNA pseudouridine65 synthase
MEMELLFADDHVAAFRKPAGLLVHRSPIARRENVFALQLARQQLGRPVWPAHRLDRPTSGVLLFGLTPEAARRLTEAFEARAVTKRYLAVVRGVPAAAGRIDHPLAERLDRVADRLARPDKEAQAAVTDYRLLAAAELPFAVGRYPSSRYALVEATPLTGRRHQIRRHFKHIFHPLVGDTTYGEGRHNRFFRDRFGCSRLLLAAVELVFPHPVGGEPVRVRSPLDAEFTGILDRLGWQDALRPWRQS